MESDGPILLVDDSDEDCRATVRALGKAAVDRPVHRCATGEEALAYLRRPAGPRPALVLLDLNLPGTDGRRVLELLRADPATRGLPVVVLTTSSNPKDIEGCYRDGANSCVVKPLRFDDFLRAVRVLAEYWFHTVALPGGGSG